MNLAKQPWIQIMTTNELENNHNIYSKAALTITLRKNIPNSLKIKLRGK